jgi:hypothetical protein
MPTIVTNDEPELTVNDCLQYIGKTRHEFHDQLERGQRIGQAWFNFLDEKDQEKLRGSLYDPFYADAWPLVIKALRFLLDN